MSSNGNFQVILSLLMKMTTGSSKIFIKMSAATQVKPVVIDVWLKHSFQQNSNEILVSNAAILWDITQ